jgi:beta-N-acetylhexosaminidase
MSQSLSIKYKTSPAWMRIILLLFCIAFFLSGCGDLSTFQSVPTPTSTPTKLTPDQKAKTNRTTSEEKDRQQLMLVRQILNGMSLDQKLGQLILVEYLGNNYKESGLQTMIEEQFVGGFMYQESNHNFDAPYDQEEEVYALSHQAMQDAQTPLLIATDQEGGLVNRLYKFHGPLPSAAEMAATGDPAVALEQGTKAAKWMAELGINADLAPVVDVHTVDPPVLVSRMFGRDPQTVATYAGAYLKGLQSNRIMGCLKHFPGLGAITSDPHLGLPTVNRSKAQLDSIDLAPYKLMIQHDQPAMIMSTDVLVPAIDPDLPAELSPKVINGVLRGELGYNGVVITDGLYMKGISERWSLSEASILAIIAGNDLLVGPFTPAQVATVVTAFKQAIEQNRLSETRIDQSVERILLMKARYGLIK